MEDSQKENGHIQIDNDIFEALCAIRIPGEARQVLDVIIRKTIGWNKEWDKISLSQFMSITGVNKPNLCRAIDKLVAMNIIIKKDNDSISSYRLQKDYKKWKPLSKKITLSKKIIPVIKKDNQALSKKIHTKDKETKTTITKDNIYPPQFEEFWKSYPRKKEKQNCYITWKQLNSTEKALVVIAAKNYATACDGTDKNFMKYPKSFLNKENWRDYSTTDDPENIIEDQLKKHKESLELRRD